MTYDGERKGRRDMQAPGFSDEIRFGADGLVPVVVQDVHSGQVLMLAYADEAAVQATMTSGEAHYFSRSRNSAWHKGETSGHHQVVKEILLDCDGDTLLYRVEQVGVACHEGTPTCFSRCLPVDPGSVQREGLRRLAILDEIWKVIEQRRHQPPAESYVATLLGAPPGKAWRKVGEEAVESVVAGLEGDRQNTVMEVADLIFHCWVALARVGIHPDEVLAELARRRTPRRTPSAQDGAVS